MNPSSRSASARLAELGRSQQRALAILLAVLGTVVVWICARLLIDGGPHTKSGSSSATPVNVVAVIIATVLAGLVGWGLLAVIERRSANARTIWLRIAVAVLVLSLAAPLASGAGGGSKLALALMHLVAAAAIIPAFARTCAAGSSATGAASRTS